MDAIFKVKIFASKIKVCFNGKGFPKEITISITMDETMFFGLTKAELSNISLWLKITLVETF